MLLSVVAICAASIGLAACTWSDAKNSFPKALANADAISRAGDQQEALSLYQKLAKADPARPEPLARIAKIQLARGDYSAAISSADEALRRDPSDASARSTRRAALKLAQSGKKPKGKQTAKNKAAATTDTDAATVPLPPLPADAPAAPNPVTVAVPDTPARPTKSGAANPFDALLQPN